MKQSNKYEFMIDDHRYVVTADKWNWIIIRSAESGDWDKGERWYFSDFRMFAKKLFEILGRSEVKKRGFQHIVDIFSSTEQKIMRLYGLINGLDKKLELGVKDPKR